MDIYVSQLGLDSITIDDQSILQIGYSSRTKKFLNNKVFRRIHMPTSDFTTDKKLISGFYVGYWHDGTKYSRKIYSFIACLKNIGGMNKILTDIGSWLNMFLCASLIRVYFA